MLMATEKWKPMSIDDAAFIENAEPLSEKEIEMNVVLIGLGLDPIRRRPAPACVWRHRSAGDEYYLVMATEPQQEVRTTVTLQAFRVPYYLPMVAHVTTRGIRRTKVTSYRPMLRGYILVPRHACEQIVELHQRRPMPIHGFLRFGDRLATVAARDVDRLRNVEEELAKPKAVQSMFDVGEVVRISDGPFSGLNATITDLANGKRITIDLPFMRRAVSTTVDVEQIEKL